MVNTGVEQQAVVGVLALQGSFAEHVHIIDQLGITGVSAIQVRTKDDLQRCTGLILPGGESTTISLLAQKGGLLEPLRQFVQDAKFDRGRAVWGTCAGMIMLASQVVGAKAGFEGLNGVDYSVVRNQWGRQTESFSHQLLVDGISETPFNAVFIRAPVVHSLLPASSSKTPPLQVLARVPRSILPPPSQAALVAGGCELGPDADVVMLRQGNVLASSFHPELTGDWRVHDWFVREMILGSQDRD